MANDNELVRELTDKKYEYGFTTDIHTEVIERGLNEDVIRLISAICLRLIPTKLC